MRRRALLIAAPLVFAVIAIVFWYAKCGRAAPQPEAAPEAKREPPANNGPSTTSSAALPPGWQAEGPGRGESPYDPVDPAGVLRLEGRVITEDAKPVVGIEISLSSKPRRTTRTEEDGSFYFEGLLPQLYRVYATSDQGIGGPGSVQLSATSEPVTLVLRAGSHLRFTVVANGSATPVVGAAIDLFPVEPGRASEGGVAMKALTDSRGVAEFRGAPPGFMQFRASAAGFATKELEGFKAPPGPVYEHRVELAAAEPIFGMVTTTAGMPVAHACIAAFSDRPCEAYTNDVGAFFLASPTANSIAAMVAPDKPSIPYLTARHPDLGVGAPQTTLADGRPQGEGTQSRPYVIELQAPRVVEGRVVNQAGAAVAGAIVRFSHRVDLPAPPKETPQDAPSQQFAKMLATAFFPAGSPAVSDAAGRFRVMLLDATGVLGAVAYTETQTSEIVAIPPDDSRAIELVLGPTSSGVLRGRVITPSGEAAEGIEVVASVASHGESIHPAIAVRGPLTATSNADGHFVITGAPHGRYRLVASLPQFARTPSARAKAEVSTDGAPTVLTLPALGSLMITATNEQGAAIQHFGVESPKADKEDKRLPYIISWTNNPDGQMLIQGIPLGTTRLIAKAKGYVDRPFEFTIAKDGDAVATTVALRRAPTD